VIGVGELNQECRSHLVGERRLDGPSASDVQRLVERVRTHAVARRNARGGRSAAEPSRSACRATTPFLATVPVNTVVIAG
jgi:hypothetical protein